jgi:hypothetical protein
VKHEIAVSAYNTDMFILFFFKKIARIFFPLFFGIDISKKFLYQQDRGH